MDPQVIAAGGTSGVAHTPTPCEERTPGVKGGGEIIWHYKIRFIFFGGVK
jgi:hypothetical protein